MTDRDKILDKIRKLRDLAEGEGNLNNEEAMANAMRKMAELMHKHAVEEHELDDVGNLERGPSDFEQKYFDQWRRWLIGECALTCGAHPIFYRKSRPAFVRIYGRPAACEATWIMFKFIEKQIVRISREMYSSTKDSRACQKGLALGVTERLHQHREMDESNPAHLPVVQEHKMSEAAMREAETGVRKIKSRKNMQWSAAAQNGLNNADRVQLREEVK